MKLSYLKVTNNKSVYLITFQFNIHLEKLSLVDIKLYFYNNYIEKDFLVNESTF